MDAASLRMAAGHERCASRAADGVRVGLGETDASGGELIDVRRDQVGRSVAVGVEGPLIVGKEDDDVWLIGRVGKGGEANEEMGDP